MSSVLAEFFKIKTKYIKLTHNTTYNMEELWNALNIRLSWPILNRVLHKNNLPTAQGKQNTFEKLELLYRTNAEAQRNFDNLINNLQETVLYRDKYLKYFDIDESTTSRLISHLKSELHHFDPSRINIGLRFPMADIEDVIYSYVNNVPELIRVIESERGISLVYSTIRQIRIRENLQGRFDNVLGVDFVNDFTSLYGERVVETQFFDIINIDSQKNIIEIRLDNYLDSTITQLETNYTQILSKANSLFGHIPGVNLNGFSHNFYSMLKKLYDDGTQGMVKEMAFITDTDSLKHEKMHYVNGADLRREPYHESGKEAVGSIDFYRLGVSWEMTIPYQNTINMAVLGKQHMLNNSNGAYINTVFIRQCHIAEEYYFILDIFENYA